MKKKVVLTILIIISLISIVFIFYKSKQQGKKIENITPPIEKIAGGITGNLPIENKIMKSDFKFPNDLSSLSISRKIYTKEEFIELSKKIGMDGEVQEFQDINEGVKYFLSGISHSLIYTPKSSILKYRMTASEPPIVINKKISDTDAEKIAIEFLTKNSIFSPENLKSINIVYLKKSDKTEGLEKTNKESAEIIQINLGSTLTNYEILTNNLVTPTIFVQILQDGSIYNAEIVLINDIQEGLTEYPVKNYDEFVNQINKSTLVNLEGEYISLAEIKKENIESITINKARIVYYQNKSSEFIQPYFLLEGPAKTTNSTINYAYLLLPAYSQIN